MIFYLAFIIFLIIVALFTSPKLSPVPYFPSNKKDLGLIISALQLRNGQTVLDLGAGDGTVIFTAASEAQKKRLDTVFVALEINPILVLILLYRRFQHANRKHIRIIWGDFFKTDYKKLFGKTKYKTCFFYISPWFLEQTVKEIRKYIKKLEVVSYFYPLPTISGLRLRKSFRNIHAVYRYT